MEQDEHLETIASWGVLTAGLELGIILRPIHLGQWTRCKPHGHLSHDSESLTAFAWSNWLGSFIKS